MIPASVIRVVSKPLEIGQLGAPDFWRLSRYIVEASFSGTAMANTNGLLIWPEGDRGLGFRISLAPTHFLDMIGSDSGTFEIAGETGSLQTVIGSRDGTASYELTRAKVHFARTYFPDPASKDGKRSTNLVVTIQVEVGDPIISTHDGAARDRQGETYWIQVVVVWTDIFKLFVHADEELAARLQGMIEAHIALKVEQPPYGLW